MSGEGVIASSLALVTAEAERADVLAYLARKRANAEAIARRSPEFADQGQWTARQISILEDDIRAGLHCGEADVADARDAGDGR